MAYPVRLIAVMRERHYKVIDNVIGRQNINFYVNSLDLSVDKNIYHDTVTEQLGDAIPHICYIETDPPSKTVKQLGWWREGEKLPILCHIPWSDLFQPGKDDEFEVLSGEGVLEGRYVIDHTKNYGEGQAISWVCNIHKKRTVTI